MCGKGKAKQQRARDICERHVCSQAAVSVLIAGHLDAGRLSVRHSSIDCTYPAQAWLSEAITRTCHITNIAASHEAVMRGWPVVREIARSLQ
jgi:hypothetical protein